MVRFFRALNHNQKGTRERKMIMAKRKKVEEANEFMNPSTAPEDAADLASALKKLARDPDFIGSLVTRAKSGKLSPAESRAVMAAIQMEPPRKTDELENWQAMNLVATEEERELLAVLYRRAIQYKAMTPAEREQWERTR